MSAPGKAVRYQQHPPRGSKTVAGWTPELDDPRNTTDVSHVEYGSDTARLSPGAIAQTRSNPHSSAASPAAGRIDYMTRHSPYSNTPYSAKRQTPLGEVRGNRRTPKGIMKEGLPMIDMSPNAKGDQTPLSVARSHASSADCRRPAARRGERPAASSTGEHARSVTNTTTTPNSAASGPARAESAKSPATRTCVAAPVANGSFQDMIRQELDSLNFERALQQDRGLGDGEDERAACHNFFDMITHGKREMTPMDLHQLLLIFTPAGVAVQEAADFLWEECDHRVSLNFREFLIHGETVRSRVGDYEFFMGLDDINKLFATFTRIYPGGPTNDAELARLHLLQASKDQMSGVIHDDGALPLRVYEHIFLAEFHRALYREGYITADCIPPDVVGDYVHEEGTGDLGCSGEAEVSWGPSNGKDKAKQPKSGRREPPHPYRSRSNKSARSTLRSTSSTQRNGGRFDANHLPQAEQKKYMGRLFEEDYAERCAQDDHLIELLQETMS